MKPTRLLCCDCTLEFDNFSCYKEHAGTKEHQQQVAETFQTVPHNGQGEKAIKYEHPIFLPFCAKCSAIKLTVFSVLSEENFNCVAVVWNGL
uniref:Uncharacterized protein n=1 Tax=Anguilla anguilla TaxID=7936 RepID=A0A0E9XJ54_ANGAN